MKNILNLSVVAAVALVLTQSIQAVPVTGVIGFAGSAQLDGSTVGSSTEVISWGSDNIVGIANGSFTGLNGLPVALMSPFFFDSGTLNNFWSVGGFHFNLSSSSVVSDTGGFLGVILMGTVTGNSFDPTAFTGRFSVQDPARPGNNGTFDYTESLSFGAVPDGGMTVLLLGMTFIGLALMKRHALAA